MGEYSKYISPKRRSVPTPKDLVTDGKCLFGTFDKEFETMDLLHIDHPTSAPNEKNRVKLTLWEATEVNMKEGILLTACSDMGFYGAILTIFYDKRTKKVTTWNSRLKCDDVTMAGNLINGSITKAAVPNANISYVNNFQDGKAHVEGACESEEGTISYNFDLTRLSKPSIVSVPFEDISVRHRPLYTQKDFFSVEGTLTINGEVLHADSETTAIIDDHKAYYPDSANYDWLTTMGVHDADGEKKWLAFNLTRNQATPLEDYNEDLIWFENDTSILPPVKFTRSIPTIDFEDYALWQVRDEYDMVHIDFHVYGVSKLITKQLPIIDMEYFIVFGELEGYIRDEDGKKYVLDGMIGLGEDKKVIINI